MGYYNNDDQSLGKAIISLVGITALIIVAHQCFTPISDDGTPYETIETTNDEDIENSTEGLFAPGEHIVAVSIEDPIEYMREYKGHPGYKPIGVSASAYGRYGATYFAGYMLFENIVDVKTNATGINEEGEYVYNNFGTPIDYEIKSYGTNAYDTYQHIVAVSYEFDGTRTQIEPVEGYEVVGVASAAYGRYVGKSAGNCLLYVNTVPVENCADEYGYPKFGTPIEKQKVLEK